MKKIAIIIFFAMCFQLEAQPIFSEKGHPEHVIAGTLIGGVTSYFIYKKTNNKLKAWLIGFGTASAAGLLKEMLDPTLLSGRKSKEDALYSALGGAIGASIVIPLKKRKPRKTPNISAAFKLKNNGLMESNYNEGIVYSGSSFDVSYNN
jgi:hypothetical protein